VPLSFADRIGAGGRSVAARSKRLIIAVAVSGSEDLPLD
jgi:hypothetical protein